MMTLRKLFWLLATLAVLSFPVGAAEMNNTGTGQWSETDASNISPAPDGWISGVMTPIQVEPTGRSMMGALKRFWDRSNFIGTTSGSSGTYIYTPANTSFPTAYVAGEVYRFRTDKASAGADVLNINGLGAKPIYTWTPSGAVALSANDFVIGQFVSVMYNVSVNSGLGGFVVEMYLPARLPAIDGSQLTNISLTGGSTTTTAMSSTIVLTTSSNKYQVFTPTADSLYIRLPDASTFTNIAVGQGVYVFRNDGNYPVGVQDSASSIISWVLPHKTITVDLKGNSAATGLWRFRIGSQLEEYGWFTGAIDAFNNGGSAIAIGREFSFALSDTSWLVLYSDSATVIKAQVVSQSPTGMTVVGNTVSIVTTVSGSIWAADIIDSSHAMIAWYDSGATQVKTEIVSVSGGIPAANSASNAINVTGITLDVCVAPGGVTGLIFASSTDQANAVTVGLSGTTVSPGTAQNWVATGIATTHCGSMSTTQQTTNYGKTGGNYSRMIVNQSQTSAPTTTLGTTENLMNASGSNSHAVIRIDNTHSMVMYDQSQISLSLRILTAGASDYSAIGTEYIAYGGSGLKQRSYGSGGTGTLIRVSATTAWAILPRVTTGQVLGIPITMATTTTTSQPPIDISALANNGGPIDNTHNIRMTLSNGRGLFLMGNSLAGAADVLMMPTYLGEAQ